MPFRYVPLLVLLLAACATRTQDDQARAIEQRLVAPCCWRQTVADHDSPIAAQIRGEIRARLAAGEQPAAIEQRFVDQYGADVRALVGRSDRTIGFAAVVLAVLGLGGVFALVRRHMRRAPAPPSPGVASVADLRAADVLDDELAAVD